MYLNVVQSMSRSTILNKKRNRIKSIRPNDMRTRSRSIGRSWKEAEGDEKEEKFHIIYIKEWEHGNITSKALWEFHRILSNHSPTLHYIKLY